MTTPLNFLVAFFNYALAGLNVYYWQEGGEIAAINLGVAVFCFGVGNLYAAQVSSNIRNTSQ